MGGSIYIPLNIYTLCTVQYTCNNSKRGVFVVLYVIEGPSSPSPLLSLLFLPLPLPLLLPLPPSGWIRARMCSHRAWHRVCQEGSFLCREADTRRAELCQGTQVRVCVRCEWEKRWERGRKEEMRMEEENGEDKEKICSHTVGA